MRKTVLAVVLVLVASVTTSTLLAQKGPNDAIGFDAGKLYQFLDTDSVDLFSGNLLLNIPIGPNYTVSPTLSYQLRLSYNSAGVWDYESWIWENVMSGDQEIRTEAFPNYRSNAGPGWRISLGRLLAPTDPTLPLPYRSGGQYGWVYEGPTGDEHRFAAAPYPNFNAGSDGPVMVTWDESALRLIKESETVRIVEFPSGERHQFELENSAWRLKKLWDRFNNFVQIAYTYDSANAERVLLWTITDSSSPGRTHLVYFERFSAMANSVDRGQNVTFIDLAGVGGVRASYDFSYESRPVRWACGNEGSPYGQPQFATLPLLVAVTLPDSTQFVFDYHTGDSDVCNQGAMKRATYPTGGWTEYVYQPYGFASNDVCSNIAWANIAAGAGGSAGIKQRKLFDGSTTRVWDYVQRRGPKAPVYYNGYSDQEVCHTDGSPVYGPFYWSRTSVLAPVDEHGKRTRSDHYFDIFDRNPSYAVPIDSFADDTNSTTYARSGPMGVPPAATRRGPIDSVPEESPGYPADVDARDSGARYLTAEVFDGCGAAGDCTTGTLLRSTYQLKEVSRFGTPVKSSRTVYQDDTGCGAACDTVITYDNYDGAGHFGSASQTSNFPGSSTSSTTASFRVWTEQDVMTLGNAWITGMYAETTRTQNGATLREQFHFDPNSGFLERHRILAGASPGIKDILNVFLPNGRGELQYALTYGGDDPTQALSTGSLDSLPLPSKPWHKVESSYSAGMLEWSRDYDRTSAQPLTFRTVDRTIDSNSGLPISGRDTSGVETAFSYDVMGRLTRIVPTGQGETTYTYQNAAGGAPASVDVKQFDAAGLTLLGQQRFIYDGLGRPRIQDSFVPTEARPAGEWVRTQTEFSAAGWKSRVTEPVSLLFGPNPAPATLFSDYDAFGRAKTIQAPDGSLTRFAFIGQRQTARTVTVHGKTGPFDSTTTERYDDQGRLIEVIEPSGDLGAPVTTEYGYDTGGRLTKVCQNKTGSTCGQERHFLYDGRGFLREERHPESGSTFYDNYDARGRAMLRRKAIASVFDQSFVYDGSDRPERIEARNPYSMDEFRVLKEYIWAAQNDGINLIRGKLASATRHNYIPFLGDIKVTESYTYGDAAGRRTDRLTMIRNETTSQTLQVLRQHVTYDDLGNIRSEDYPLCDWQWCGTSTKKFDRVERAYTLGRLTSVNSIASQTLPFASSIKYYPNGMVSKIVHGNGVTEAIALDPSGMARPQSFTFSPYSECTDPVITAQPQSQFGYNGNTVTLAVSATGPALRYQWYNNAGAINNATLPSYTTPALTQSDTYWVRVTSWCGTRDSDGAEIGMSGVTSSMALINVLACDGPPAMTTQPQSSTIPSGQTVTLSVVASGTGPFTYQWYVGAAGVTTTPLGGNAASYTTVALTATTQYWVMVMNDCGPVNSQAATVTVLACATAPTIAAQPQSSTISNGQTATLTVTASGTGPFTYQWYRGTTGTTTAPVGTNSATFTTPTLTTTTQYWVRVSNACGGTNSQTGTVTVLACSVAPGISTQPQSQTIASGQTATLTVTASGVGPFTYQWYAGASGTTTTPVGINAASFTTPALTATTQYWVRVSNACGGTNSQTGTVTVLACSVAPGISTQPQSQTIASGQTATLTVTASGVGPFTYQWYAGASGTTTTPVGINAASFTTPALTATTQYWVRVSNGCGSVNSITAIITMSGYATPVRRQMGSGVTGPSRYVVGSWPSATQPGSLLLAFVATKNYVGVTPPSGWQQVSSAAGVPWLRVYAIQGAEVRSGVEKFNFNNNTSATILIAEYTGIATSGALDGTAITSGYGLEASSGTTATTSQPNELVVTFLGAYNNPFGTPPNDFAEVLALYPLSVVHQRVVTATGTYGHTRPLSFETDWVGLVLTWRAKLLP